VEDRPSPSVALLRSSLAGRFRHLRNHQRVHGRAEVFKNGIRRVFGGKVNSRLSPYQLIFFWNAADSPKAIVGSWRKRLSKLFRLAEVPNGHAHRFRDAFAVALLLAGVPIERVSIFLGHQSVRVTEQHYNPWVRSRQEQLEADVARTWALDPTLAVKNLGTNQVHTEKRRIN